MSDSVDNLIGTLAGAGIGVYVFSVVWHGNTKTLGHMLMQEEGYAEFVAALLVLGMLNKFGFSGKITTALTTMAIIGVLIRIGAKTDINTALAKFASGQASALDTLKALFHGE